MDEYIKLSDAISLIEEKQKEFCPLGKFSRNATYGSDREAFDRWQEIIDKLQNISADDVEPVVHGRWISTNDYVTTAYGSLDIYECSVCRANVVIDFYDNYCPSCGAKMGGKKDEAVRNKTFMED